MNPYQGLKRFVSSDELFWHFLSKLMNPYQGLKQACKDNPRRSGLDAFKANESLSGIETGLRVLTNL